MTTAERYETKYKRDGKRTAADRSLRARLQGSCNLKQNMHEKHRRSEQPPVLVILYCGRIVTVVAECLDAYAP